MGLKIKILSKTELNTMPLASKLAAKAAAATAATAASKSAKSATAAISGSSDHISADRMAGGGSDARVEPSSTPKSTHRAAEGGRAATRAAPPPHTKSSHHPETSVAASSTLESSRRTEHRETSRHSERIVSRAEFEQLKHQLGELRFKTTDTGSRLADVEKDVRETRGDTSKILALLMTAKNEQAMLPASSRRRAIMSRPTEDLTESESEDDEIEYVSYGKGDQERFSLVPKWGVKKSTPVACKGGSATASSSQRKDLSKAPGCGAMVVSSKSRQQPLPLPETLGKSGKDRSSSPRIERLHGTGLVQCTDFSSLVKGMKKVGYTEVPVIIEKTKYVSMHFMMVIANAYDLSKDEAQMLAMLSADSGRSASRISDACQIRDEVIDCYSSKNVGMFMKFFARMAENYHSNPKNGVEISGQLYSYVVLGNDVQICTSFLKYLRKN